MNQWKKICGRSPVAAFLAVAVLLAGPVGCTTVVDVEDAAGERRREPDVVVEQNGDEEPGGEPRPDAAAESWILSQYERALSLYEEGQVQAAGALMVSVREQAEAIQVELPEGFEENYRRIKDVGEGGESEPAHDQGGGEEALLETFGDELRRIRSEEAQTEPAPAGDMQAGEGPVAFGGDGDEHPLYGEMISSLTEADYDQPEFRLPGLLDPELAEEEIILDFNQVDIRIVLETISDITGANFLVDGAVSGTVTLISSSEVKLSEVFRVLESILDVHGWAAVPSDDVIKVLPRGEGVRKHIPTRIGTDPARIPRDDSFATQVMRLQHVDVAEAAPLIEPRMSPDGSLSAHEPTNTVFITDISSNIYQIALMLNQIDLPRAREELVIFPLRYASARSVAEKINTLIESANNAGPRWRTELKILPDARTNSLIVFAVEEIVESIGNLVENLDVPRPEESVNVHVIKLDNADAQEMVDSLSTTVDALTDYDDAEPIHITADVPTNSLIIAASPQDFQVLRTVIGDLDVVREQVLVELRIMEVSQFALEELGFDWATMDAPSEDSVRGLAGTDLGPRRELMTDPFGMTEPGLGAALIKGRQVGAAMRALERHRSVDVLSTPHILTSNHQTASISVVENVPFVRESRIVFEEDRDVIRTFDYRDVGIQLNITPHIGAGGMVRMVIGSEFSKVVEEQEGQLRTSKREADTTVSVESGETVVIGGLIQDDKVILTKQVPLLGSIPLLGRLFRFESEDVEKTNLLIFITPHVLSDMQDLAEMSQRKETETRQQNEDRAQ